MTMLDQSTAMKLFDNQVQLKYQNMQYLMGTTAERHGTQGTALNIPISPIGEMAEIGFSAGNIAPTQAYPTNRILVQKNYGYKTVIGGGEKTLFAYDEIVEQAQRHALAAGRLQDLIKIQAIFNDPDIDISTYQTIAADVGPTTGLSSQKLVAGIVNLENAGVMTKEYGVSLWMPALVKQSFFDDDKVVNFFYNSAKPLSDNTINAYMDTDIRTLGSAGTNQIPFTTPSMGVTEYLVPLLAKNAVMVAYNRDVKTSITYVAQEDRYELLTVCTVGAKVLQTEGIVLLTCDVPSIPNA